MKIKEFILGNDICSDNIYLGIHYNLIDIIKIYKNFMGNCSGSIDREKVNLNIKPIFLQALNEQHKDYSPDKLITYQQYCNGKKSNFWYKSKKTIYNYAYRGEWLNSYPHGRGWLYHLDHLQIIYGCFNEGKLLQDKCFKVYQDGAFYLGEVNQNLMMHGYGSLKFSGFAYLGQFSNGNINGQGSLKIKKSTNQEETRIGYFETKKFIKGKIICKEGTYIGNFENNLLTGLGVFIWVEGGKYIGQFKQGKKMGKGVLYDSGGMRVRVGQWIDDEIVY